jgi:hypothetical protein
MFLDEFAREILEKMQNWAGKMAIARERSMLSRNSFHQRIELVELYLEHVRGRIYHKKKVETGPKLSYACSVHDLRIIRTESMCN